MYGFDSRLTSVTRAIVWLGLVSSSAVAQEATTPRGGESPSRVVRVEVVPQTLPAVVGVAASPIVKLVVEIQDQQPPLSLTGLQVTLDGTSQISDVAELLVFQGERVRGFANAKRLGKVMLEPNHSGPVELSCSQTVPLETGLNTLWIAARLSTTANLDHRVGIACQRVTFSNGETIELEAPPTVQRLALALRDHGDDGVDTFRIPGLATTQQGTLIAVYDIRRRKGSDLPGDVDVGLSRSTDGGRHWEPMRVLMDMGNDPQWSYDGIGDPAVLVDRQTGTLWVAATWSHGNRSWHGSGPGLTPEETGQLMLVRSDDDGLTWSAPINITKQVKRPEWCFVLQGPGKGITMQDGTLVFAAQFQDTPENKRKPRSTILYSQDHGQTWHIGTGAFGDTTESQVVELEPGVLMLNCRFDLSPTRVVMLTRDLGNSWQPHSSTQQALIEPQACMASLIDLRQEVGASHANWLLFSNPNSQQERERITIKASPDRGQAWPESQQILLDEGRSAGYSCLSMIDANTIGIVYEGSVAQLTFQRIPLGDVIGEK